MQNKQVLNLQVKNANAPSLWEEDRLAKDLVVSGKEIGRANAQCQYGCGCAVGYLFKQDK